MYFMPQKYTKDATIKQHAHKLAFAMVNNDDWIDIRNGGGQSECDWWHNRSGFQRVSGEERTWHQVSIDGGPPSRESPCKHILVPLGSLPGFSSSGKNK